ncbi:MAG: cache domain-containing protein, partial [Anaerolineales bacterium]|nr:cache domain-containing protein [Anaerolineales bacterium]
MKPPADASRSDTSLAAGLLLTAAGLALAFTAAANLRASPVAPALAISLAVFAAAAGAALALARTGRPLAAAGVLIGSVGALGLVLAALVADIGVPLGFVVAVAIATAAGVALDRAPARFVILGGVITAALTMLVDLFIDTLAPWPRLVLEAPVHDTYLPAATAGLILLLAGLIARRFPSYRLSTKLLIGFLSVALVPLTLVSVWNDLAASAALRASASQSLLAAAAQTAATLESFVGTAANAVQTAGQLPALTAVLRLAPAARPGSAAEQQAKAGLNGLPNPILPNISARPETRLIQAYVLLDAQGRPAASTAPGLPPADLLAGDLFTVPRNLGRGYASPVVFVGAGQARLYFSTPVRDAGQITGVLVGEVNGAWLQRLIVQNNT